MLEGTAHESWVCSSGDRYERFIVDCDFRGTPDLGKTRAELSKWRQLTSKYTKVLSLQTE
jgi:hypothetical protein